MTRPRKPGSGGAVQDDHARPQADPERIPRPLGDRLPRAGQPTLVACPAQYGALSWRLSSLPEPVRGSSAMNDTERGDLYPARCRRAKAMTSASDSETPGAGTTAACTCSPHFSDGMPNTATSKICGSCSSAASTSAG